jgi:hypothetical protein
LLLKLGIWGKMHVLKLSSFLLDFSLQTVMRSYSTLHLLSKWHLVPFIKRSSNPSTHWNLVLMTKDNITQSSHRLNNTYPNREARSALKYNPIWTCHNESLVYNECILIKFFKNKVGISPLWPEHPYQQLAQSCTYLVVLKND